MALLVPLYNRVEDLNDSWKAADRNTVETVKKFCDYNNIKEHPGYVYYERTDMHLLEMVTLDRLLWACSNRNKDISEIEIPRHAETTSDIDNVKNSYLQPYFKLGQQGWKDIVLDFIASYKDKEGSSSIPQEKPSEKCSVSQLIKRTLSRAELRASENAVRANFLYAGLAIRTLLLVSNVCSIRLNCH